MKYIIAFLLLFIFGCDHIRPDPSLPALQSEYPTLEFHLGGHVYQGVGIQAVAQGTDLSMFALDIQTYYSGTLRIDSKDCDIGITQVYSNSEVVPVPLVGLAEKTCVISVTMNPVYPPQTKDPIQVYGLKGYFVIRVVNEGDSWVGDTFKVTGNFSKPVHFNVGKTPLSGGLSRAVFAGCGLIFDQKILVDEDGFVNIDLNELVEKNEKSTCILEGVIMAPEVPNLLVDLIVSQYDEKFTPLALPEINTKGTTLSVIGDSSVSVISLDSKYIFSTSTKFKKFDSHPGHVLRLITVKGRSVVCVLEKEWVCLQ